MSAVRVLRREVGCASRVMLRSPQTLFLVVALPVLYLVIFGAIFSGEEVNDVPGRSWNLSVSVIMTASVVVIGVVSATFQSLTMTLAQDRERGVLKRLRSTPLPSWVFFTAQVLTALLVSVALAVLVTGCGALAFDVALPGRRTPAALVTLIVGALSCSLVALPFSVLVRRSAAALPLAFGVSLGLFFLSGNFFPGKALPDPVASVADIFPVRHFFVAMLTAFDPHTTGAGFEWDNLAVLGGWAVAGALLALRWFRWAPTGDR
ncbi:MAG: ABC transporter permease [Dactylosporangium sp.]|nr:ABC transporter permease [Dactylosporangium sp.]NNJ60208.1 ABC transporter permease [Dactylosporangium sp.]